MSASSSPTSPLATPLTVATSHRVVAPELVGRHPAHLAALKQIESYARFEHVTVLIEGESGTGKSYMARLLHQCSPRAQGVYHQVILSSLNDNLAASALFGHLRGSFTDAREKRAGYFVAANHGTLFLDEIGKATPAVQRMLLHAVEHREIRPVGADQMIRIDVRLVVASNIPLQTLVERGVFLDDLAARLVNFRVRLPALRERREDIPVLVRQFVGLRAEACGHALGAPRVHDDLMAALSRAEWPYNLRQLDGVIQRLLMEAAATASGELSLEHCTGDLAYLREGTSGRRTPTPQIVRARMTELGSATKVARSLGISRWTVYRYLERTASREMGTDA
jgi:DNA-binding NtrC family response regulator